MIAAIAIVSMLGLTVDLLAWNASAPIVEPLWNLLSLSAEGNVPTWFASSLLLVCALVAGSIAAQLAAGAPWRTHWWGIALALGYVSLDEVVGLHEQLGGMFETGGVLYFDWVLVAAPIVGVLAIVYWPFLRALVPRTRMRLILAAVIYVGGALGMELPLGWWTERAGDDNLVYALIDWVEETLELVGAGLALVAFVKHREEAA